MITRLRPAAALYLMAVLILTGCRPQSGAAPSPTPTPAVVATPAIYRVGFVDLGRALRAHRRWPEMEALVKQMDAIQVRLSNPPPPPEGPVVDLGPELQAEVERLQAAYRVELSTIDGQIKQRIEAFAADLKAEQEGRLADRHKQLNAELQRVIEAKRDEMQRELDRFELATMAEYRVPLLNLRLKGDVVGVTSEEEARRLNQEAERITQERDAKVRARAQALEKALEEFQKAKTAEAEAQIKALIVSLENDANARIQAKQEEAGAEMQAAMRVREESLNRAMEERRKILVGSAGQQMKVTQEAYARRVEAQAGRLRQELETLAGQRFRLEDSLLAEIKIEVAALAQEQKIDAVLTRVLASTTAVDLTQAVIARIRRP
ncbi:MAG: hypothetical protein RDU83_04165 [bacterium]|nr:hypothetical protein [bacterium]